MLLDAGADPLRAIFFAIEFEDTVATAMILNRECPFFFAGLGEANDMGAPPDTGYVCGYAWSYHFRFARSLLHYAFNGCNYNQDIVDILVQRLVKDRRSIKESAMKELSEDEKKSFGLHLLRDIDVLDMNVFGVWRALKQHNVDVPSYLWPGGENSNSIYHDIRHGFQAETLYENGFHAIDVPNSSNYTPLFNACTHGQWDVIKWFLDKGAVVSPRLIYNNKRSCLHEIARNYQFHARRSRGDSSIAQRLSDQVNPSCADDCRCFCSTYGCTPVRYVLVPFHGSGWASSSEIASLESWLEYTGVTIIQREGCYAEACRLEMFHRLGMAHTCCANDYRLSDEDRLEMQSEDSELRNVLDAYLQLYKDLRKQHSGSLSSFWKAWWTIMDDFLPREDNQSVARPQMKVYDGSESELNEFDCVRSNASGFSGTAETGTEIDIASWYPNRAFFFGKMQSLVRYKHTIEDLASVFSDCLSILCES
jgi:hypothetical protein